MTPGHIQKLPVILLLHFTVKSTVSRWFESNCWSNSTLFHQSCFHMQSVFSAPLCRSSCFIYTGPNNRAYILTGVLWCLILTLKTCQKDRHCMQDHSKYSPTRGITKLQGDIIDVKMKPSSFLISDLSFLFLLHVQLTSWRSQQAGSSLHSAFCSGSG